MVHVSTMIDLHYWHTPNGHKISIALEELALPYQLFPVNIGRGDQFKPEFLAISPNNRIPAIVDHEPAGGGAPISIFESGAILLYLAEKTGKLLPTDVRRRYEVIQWLMWQMGGLGPMLGQASHFTIYAKDKIPYAIDRYVNESKRLFRVLDQRLADREYVAGDYSIADIAAFPWVNTARERLISEPTDYPHLQRWVASCLARPAVARGLEVGKAARNPTIDDEARRHLFGDPAKP